MFVGILRLTLFIGGAQSLKEKRHALRKLLDRARAKYNVAAAEVGDHDLWQRATIGFTTVANDRAFVNEVLDKVAHDVERSAVAEVVNRELEIESVAEMRPAPDKPRDDPQAAAGDWDVDAEERELEQGGAAQAGGWLAEADLEEPRGGGSGGVR